MLWGENSGQALHVHCGLQVRGKLRVDGKMDTGGTFSPTWQQVARTKHGMKVQNARKVETLNCACEMRSASKTHVA